MRGSCGFSSRSGRRGQPPGRWGALVGLPNCKWRGLRLPVGRAVGSGAVGACVSSPAIFVSSEEVEEAVCFPCAVSLGVREGYEDPGRDKLIKSDRS